MAGISDPTAKLVNKTFFDNIQSGDSQLIKRAQDAVSEYTRMKMREDGFLRKILPPMQIQADDLDRAVDTDKPIKICDKEPDSPAAYSLPFRSNPINQYISGPRYAVMFDRILTPKFTKDVDELLTYDMDIRQILSDNSIKDMLAEEDSKLITAVNTILSNGTGTADQVQADTGVVQWKTISGGITRNTVAEAMKVMNDTSSHLEPTTILVNHKTVKDIMKWGRDEMGGDLSQDLVKKGWSEREFMGANWIVTIKRDLVPDGTIFMFAEPKFLGKFFVLQDTTMYIDRKYYFIEFFAYETIGATLANPAAMARVDFS